MTPRRAALALLLPLIALSACGNDNDNDSTATRAEVLTNLSTDVMTPAYEQLDQSTTALASTTKKLCESPDKVTLGAARMAWEVAWSDWHRTRAFRFGPIVEHDSGADIAFPVDTEKIDKLVTDAGKAPVTVALLSEKGADVRGLGAAEHLLFERDPLDPNVCAYAAAAAQLTARSARQVRVAWTDASDDDPAFRDQLATPGDGRYLNAQGAVNDLVNGLSMALSEATRELANAKAAPPGEREPMGRHGGSRARAELESAHASYFGTSSVGTDGDGVSDVMAAVSPTTDQRVRDLLEAADRAVEKIPDSLDDASAAELTAAYEAVRKAGTAIRAEVASELGVILSLTDADGDS